MSNKFNCDNIKIKNATTILDFNKNFKLTAPSNWKTELYFDKYQSEIFVADTTKQLTESFILITSFNQGMLNFDANFHNKIDSISIKEKLQIINFGTQIFLLNPTYWYVSKGEKNGFTYHQFNVTIKLSENTYFNAYSEIYGDNNIEERICESIAILEKIKFLQ
ncbi:MAG: hypothetical protein JKY16_04215 [Lutibacter sp.]|nr:hypothetical protein [Lutibacter sp.]